MSIKIDGLRKLIFVFLVVSISFQLVGCCRKKKVQTSEKKYDPVVQTSNSYVPEVVSEESDKILKNAGLNYSINDNTIPAVERKIALQPSGLGVFEKNYLHGVELLEKNDLGEAMSVFRDLLEQFPDGEEASIASLCIAEIMFRSKNNEGALKMYREIIKKFPGTQAAMNAAEGIKYLETFEKYEKNYIAPELEDRRRGR